VRFRQRRASPTCGRTWGRASAACRTRRCAGGCPRTSTNFDVRVVDIFAVGLPAVLETNVLPAVRALQRRHLAAAERRACARMRNPRAVLASSGRAGEIHRRHPRAMLDLGRMGLSLAPFRDDQLGRDVCRVCVRVRSAAAHRLWRRPRRSRVRAWVRPASDRLRARYLRGVR